MADSTPTRPDRNEEKTPIEEDGAFPETHPRARAAFRGAMGYIHRIGLPSGIQKTNTTWLLKHVLFLTNVCFMIGALIVVVIGVLFKFGAFEIPGTTIPEHSCGFLKTFPSMLLVIGTGIFILAYTGCYGAHKSDVKLLFIYALVLGLIFLTQTVVSVTIAYGAAPVKGLQTEIRNNLLRTYGGYDRDQKATQFIDDLQRTYKCCGMYNAHCMRRDNGTYPSSCCSNRVNDCKRPFQKGCWEEFYSTALHSIYLASKVMIFISVIEVVEILLAVFLAFAILHDRHAVRA